ncbi:hypothetical protein Emed_006510 [Eimeria media]
MWGAPRLREAPLSLATLRSWLSGCGPTRLPSLLLSQRKSTSGGPNHRGPLRGPYGGPLPQDLGLDRVGGPLCMGAPRAAWRAPQMQSRGYFSLPNQLKLQDVVKLPLLQRLPRGKVEEIWKTHLLSKPHSHAATIDGSQHERFSTNAHHTPTFILPLPRGPGAFEVLFAQFQRNCCLVTSLEQYKQNPTSAAPLFLLTFYAELKQSHDLVLLKGDSLSPAVGPREAQHLTHVLLASYTDANKYEWVARFNLAPNTFDFEAFKEANPDFFRFPLPERQPYASRQNTENEFDKIWIP